MLGRMSTEALLIGSRHTSPLAARSSRATEPRSSADRSTVSPRENRKRVTVLFGTCERFGAIRPAVCEHQSRRKSSGRPTSPARTHPPPIPSTRQNPRNT